MKVLHLLVAYFWSNMDEEVEGASNFSIEDNLIFPLVVIRGRIMGIFFCYMQL